jgi:DNA-binding response OmpR family regulator
VRICTPPVPIPRDVLFRRTGPSPYRARMSLVLLVEDDHAVRAALTRALRQLGHVVHPVGSALDALRTVTETHVDIVVLDLGLPDLDGAEALRMLRGLSDVPVIVATARGDERSTVRLLNAGADDYLVKPFSAEHIGARIAAVLRRSRAAGEPEDERIAVGELCIDTGSREVFLGSEPLTLTRREFDLLAYLAHHRGRVVPKAELCREVWQQPHLRIDQTIDVHLSWLRRKLGESAARPRYLHTVRGVGVKLVEPSGRSSTG